MTQGLEVSQMPAHELRAEFDRFEQRVIRQRDALIQLTGHQVTGGDSLPEILQSILEVSAATLDVDRASIWRYSDRGHAITCTDLYERGARRHSAGFTLDADQYPAYFKALGTCEVVAADDAASDDRTREFAASYLRPLGIGSMLDAPLHIDAQVDGVLCHEHVGAARHWTADERSFAVAVSNLISLAFERFGRRRAESAMALQSAALNASADAVVITDRSSSIVWVNPAFSRLTGYLAAEAIGRNPRALLNSGLQNAAFYEEMWRTLLDGRVWRGELVNRRKDGGHYPEELTITPVTTDGEITHFVAIKRDLTTRRNLEAQFLQAQKMEVVGRLAGGIAHDFNNLLTVINGTAEMALMDLAPKDPLRAEFERIRDSGDRAASLTRQLLAFSRKQIARRELVDLGGLLTNFRNMLQRLIGEDVHLTVGIAEGLDHITADPSQIEQVILNLAVNARDAMPVGGRLLIDAGNVLLDDRFAAAHPGAAAGRHVVLAVTDTGTGMSAATLRHLFEPFFTTKEIGKGTGLGLATVYGIVQQTGGAVLVESELGKGTTFRVYLPSVPSVEIATGIEAAPPLAGNETVLLVEDEDAVRDLATRILEGAGHTVLAARDAVSALDRLKSGADVALMVTDVVLAGMSGRELAARAAELRPGLPVLYTSGYTDDTVLAHGVRHNLVHFIPKPFTPAALTHKVRDILGPDQRA